MQFGTEDDPAEHAVTDERNANLRACFAQLSQERVLRPVVRREVVLELVHASQANGDHGSTAR